MRVIEKLGRVENFNTLMEELRILENVRIILYIYFLKEIYFIINLFWGLDFGGLAETIWRTIQLYAAILSKIQMKGKQIYWALMSRKRIYG